MNELTVTCPSCSQSVTTDGPNCPRCGANIVAQRIEAATAAMAALHQQFRERTAKPGGSSVNGWGTMLLGHYPRGDGTWDVTRWFTVAGLPIVPLRGLHIRPIRREGHNARERLLFDVLGEGRPSGRRVLRTYGWLAAGALPILVYSLWSSMRERLFGDGPLAFSLALPLAAWAMYALYRIHDSHNAFRPKQRDAARA